jgi:hypothetical protein
MIALVMTLTLVQAPCAESAALVAAASDHAAAFDLDGAVALLARRAPGCMEIDVPAWYLRGLLAAKEAYRYGGSPESLALVRTAIAELTSRAKQAWAAEIARVVLLAASAAAQSEREEMALLLDHAIGLEQSRRAAGESGAPIVSAHEVAGDLWLQVHRFEDARLAFRRAARAIGPTRRVTLGLARSAARLENAVAACAEYRRLIAGWRPPMEPPEIVEARAFVRRSVCQNPPAGRARP